MNGHAEHDVEERVEKEESKVLATKSVESASSSTSIDDEPAQLEVVKLHEKLTDPTKFAFCSLAAVVLRLDFGEDWNKC